MSWNVLPLCWSILSLGKLWILERPSNWWWELHSDSHRTRPFLIITINYFNSDFLFKVRISGNSEGSSEKLMRNSSEMANRILWKSFRHLTLIWLIFSILTILILSAWKKPSMFVTILIKWIIMVKSRDSRLIKFAFSCNLIKIQNRGSKRIWYFAIIIWSSAAMGC